jgi:magnesium transporter
MGERGVIPDELIATIEQHIAARDRAGIVALSPPVSSAQWAEILPRLEPREIAVVLEWLPLEDVSDVLAELDPAHAAVILRTLAHHQAAEMLAAMDPDDATDVIERIPPLEAERIFDEMEPVEAAELRELLAYPPETAGGIMTPAFVAIAPDLRADQAIQALRRVAEEAETLSYVYAVDPADRLIGVLSLHSLVFAPPEMPVGDLLIRDVIQVRADEDQEVAAGRLVDHNLLALPVVDAENRLLGIITQDDVAEILEREATEDIERLGGSAPLEVPYRLASVPILFRRRIVWLLMLFIAEAYTGTVMRAFEDELTQVVSLTFFVPLLIGTGGNIGSQTTTTLVRAIAVGEVRLRDVGWVLRKEVVVSVLIGLVMAVVAFGRSQLLHVGVDVGLVVALTIACICLWSATIAAILPLILRRLGIDEAVVSAPMITTLVDGTGLVIYFTIAKYLLGL